MNEIQRTAPSSELVAAMKAHVAKAAKDATDAEVTAFVMVCNQLGLNPVMGEVHAMRDRAGTLRPIPSIDGWTKVVRQQPDFRGVQFAEIRDEEGDLDAIECSITIEGWDQPCVVREYLAECRRNTPVWKTMPTRMLRHRALIQCARIAFGLGLADVEDVRDDPHDANANTNTNIAPVAKRDGLAELQALVQQSEEDTDDDFVP